MTSPKLIFFNRLASGEIVLLMVYAKAKFDNLKPEFLLTLKERFDEKAKYDIDPEVAEFEMAVLRSIDQAARGEGRGNTSEQMAARRVMGGQPASLRR